MTWYTRNNNEMCKGYEQQGTIKKGRNRMKTGIAVCFPGTGFTCKEALFERLGAEYAARGYDVIKLDFSHIPFKEIETLEEAIAVAQRAARTSASRRRVAVACAFVAHVSKPAIAAVHARRPASYLASQN